MHETSYQEMKHILRATFADDWQRPLVVLDVGSAVCGGDTRTYREVCSPRWTYRGCDLQPGENVDFVMRKPYEIQERGEEYDLVLCGQVLEHVCKPWLLVPEIARMLKPGGVAILTAPWHWHVHRFPRDYWRILEDGMLVLLGIASLVRTKVWTIDTDTWGMGFAEPKPMPSQEIKE